MTETIGDNYNISCPYCGKINHYIFTTKIPPDIILVMEKACWYCKRLIKYKGRFEIKVTAERIDGP